MSEPNFTPGPWTAHTFMVKAGHDKICQTGYSSSLGPARSHEAEANARLIAAAPDLYAQLEDARVTLEEAAKLLVSHYPSVANNLVNQCAIRCGDVLAKARGER